MHVKIFGDDRAEEIPQTQGRHGLYLDPQGSEELLNLKTFVSGYKKTLKEKPECFG